MVNYSIIHLWLTSVQGAGWTIWYALNACECSLIELAKRFFKSYCTMLKIFTKLFPAENFIISLWSSTYLGNEVVLVFDWFYFTDYLLVYCFASHILQCLPKTLYIVVLPLSCKALHKKRFIRNMEWRFCPYGRIDHFNLPWALPWAMHCCPFRT